MVRVSIIGSGNVAQHLASAFEKTPGIELVEVYSRSESPNIAFLDKEKIVSDLCQLREADAYLVAVTDDAIAAVSTAFPFQDKLVAHTSGSVAMTDLDAKNRRAVFYPLQTFSKNKAVNFREIPICLESEYPDDFAMLQKIADAISDTTFAIDSQQRKAIHVSAVFVNNFVNHLYKMGYDICAEHQVPFEILKPLIRETAQKIIMLTPAEAQTGPAKRHDQQTIEKHLALLTNENQKNIYKLLTQSIQSHE